MYQQVAPIEICVNINKQKTKKRFTCSQQTTAFVSVQRVVF